MENGQMLRSRSQALDQELAGVLMKISDTAERAARNGGGSIRGQISPTSADIKQTDKKE